MKTPLILFGLLIALSSFGQSTIYTQNTNGTPGFSAVSVGNLQTPWSQTINAATFGVTNLGDVLPVVGVSGVGIVGRAWFWMFTTNLYATNLNSTSSFNWNTTITSNLTANNMTVSNAPTLVITNASPANVTIGVTAPDKWITITNNGVAMFIPAWIAH